MNFRSLFSARGGGRLSLALAVGVFAVASSALAQPVNDQCTGAIAIPAGTYPVTSAITDVAGSTTTNDPAYSCSSTTGRRVFYTFTPDQNGIYLISTCNTTGQISPISDTMLEVIDGVCAANTTWPVRLGACNDESPTCASRSSTTAYLQAGHTYFVMTGPYGSTTTTGTVAVTIDRENGPKPANDSCGGAVSTSLNTPVQGTTAFALPDYSLDAGTAYFDGGVGNTATSAAGRDVVYNFTAAADGLYSFRMTPLSTTADSVLYINDACATSGLVPNVLSAANRNTSGAEEVACFPMITGQSVFAFVDESTLSSGGTFELEVTSCAREVEPNDPIPNPAPACGLEGSVPSGGSTSGDHDYFDIGAPAAGSRIFALVDGYAANSTDLDLRVNTGTPDSGTTLEYDDVDNDTRFGGSAPNVAGTVATGAPLMLQVNGFSTSGKYDPYRLYSVIQGTSASATPEVEPNDTIANASGGASNYFSGSFSASTDVDYFAFTANAGELVFLSLDSNPNRVTSGIPNGQLAIVDSTGTVLLNVNGTTSTTASNTAGTTVTSSSPTSPGEGLVWRIRTTGLYYAKVTASAAGPYLVSISRNCTTGGGIGAPGAISAISPNTGPGNGGQTITITGSGFSAGARVRIGGAFATGVVVNSATQITAVTPAGVNGPALVEVIHPGNQISSLPNGYTYVAPTFSSIAPNNGSTLGGTNVVITGSNFNDPPVSVTVGGVALSGVVVDSATQLHGTTGAHAAGNVAVVVTTASGTISQANAFTYISPPTISSVTQNHGTTLGGETVTIAGSNFNLGTIKWDGVALTPVGTPTATQIVITTPAHAAGAISVQVVNADGQQDTVANAFTYISPPSITTIVPNNGISTGGDTVTINGANFTTGATVTFDGTPATNVTVSPTGDSITVTDPGHATLGPVNVVVTNPDGQTATAVNGFTYTSPYPAPVISSITPASGTTYGGTTVVLSMSNLRPNPTLTFDGAAQTGFQVDLTSTPQTITFVTPAHVFGAVPVVVTNDDMQTASTTYTYVAPAPTLTAITPSSGRTAGGLLITITGNEFLTGATVDLSGTACLNPTVPNKNTIQCTTPAHAAGFVTVTVTNPDTKTVAQTNGFEFIAPPAASTLAPTSGTSLGGTTVVITGTSFRGPATVQFGATAATAVTVDSATQITAVAPPHAAGVVSVTVTNADGQFSTLNNAYTYYAPPTITAINPVAGYAVGGTNVTLTGTAFRAGATVKFVVGGVSADATNITVVSATSITAKTPAQTPGLADVVVTNVDGQTFTLANAFQFVPAPTLSAVTPNHGGANGGTRITITGTNFQAGATVTLGGSPAVGVVLVDAQTLTATTNPHPAGTVDLVVTNPDGQTVTLASAFTFDEAPMITGVTPDLGPVAGGNTVTIEGSGFLAGAAVKFGTSDATVTNVTATAVTVTVPARPAGVVSVRLTNSDGQTATLANAYRYVNPVGLDSITPATGPSTGGTRVTLTGTNITAGSTVTFGGVAAVEVFVLSDTTVQALTPAHDAGAVDVVITTPNSGSATLTAAFTYESTAPTLTDVAPKTGTTEGGTTVSLTGTGFAAGAKVTIGGQQATDVTVVSSSLIRAVTPPHAAGQVTVDVTNPDGLGASLSAAYTYVAPVDTTNGQVSDGGTGGVTGEQGNDIIKPAPACGCNAASLPALSMMSLLALSFLRRRRK